ncbi:D-inositol-3-phosphate glycosyltransferase [subsurface metagenome]
MKILFVNQSKYITGAENSLYETLKLLKNRYRLYLASPFSDEIYKKFQPVCEKIFWIDLFIPDKRIRNLINFIKDIIRFIKAEVRLMKVLAGEKIGVVHSNSVISGLFVVLPALLLRKRFFLHVREIYLDRRVKYLARIIFFFAEKVVFVSEATKFNYLYSKDNNKKFYVIYNVVPTLGSKIKSNNNSFYKRPVDLYNISYIGLIDERKGIDVLIKAVNFILKNSLYKHFKVNIFGRAIDKKGIEYEKLLKSLVSNYGLDDFIIFRGFSPDIQKIYNDTDILIHPARVEPLARVLVEALYFGKVVIASDISGNAEIIKDNVNGVLFKSGDFRDLAEKIIDVFKNYAHYRNKFRSYNLNFLKIFSKENHFKNLIKLYEKN